MEKVIDIYAFGQEIGRLGYDIDARKCLFQYNEAFLSSGRYANLFPFIVKKNSLPQTFTQYEGPTFKGLLPMIADSLPDMFGNIVFQEWLKAQDKSKVTPLEQLTYVANRGMGALEYQPVKELPKSTSVNIEEMVGVLQQVLDQKNNTSGEGLNDLSLLNIFKMGTSAGGARAKLLVSEHKKSGIIIPGDVEYSGDYHHYLVKLCMDEDAGYNKEKVEYAYYLLAQEAGVEMMPSKMIEEKHFATLRFDRQHGEKQHVLTASGLTGWDFKDPENSSYENLFQLATTLKVPHKDLQQLYKRMVFNIVLANIDDHLKNHSFIYDKEKDQWGLAPAYDITYPLNALNNYTKVARALSINHKRQDINLEDLLVVAEKYTIKNPQGIIDEVQAVIPKWESIAQELAIPKAVIHAIESDFKRL